MRTRIGRASRPILARHIRYVQMPAHGESDGGITSRSPGDGRRQQSLILGFPGHASQKAHALLLVPKQNSSLEAFYEVMGNDNDNQQKA